MSYILPQALCALLWWMAAHPDEVGALAKATLAEATEEEGDDEELDWRAQEEPVVDEPLDPNAQLPPIPAVEGVVVHREPLGGGEVLEYVWRDEEEREESEHADVRRTAKRRRSYNGLRVIKDGAIIAAHRLPFTNYSLNQTVVNTHQTHITIWLYDEYDISKDDLAIHVLQKNNVVDALRRPRGYRTRKIRSEMPGQTIITIENQDIENIYIKIECCGDVIYRPYNIITMKSGPNITITPICDITPRGEVVKNCRGSFRIGKRGHGISDKDFFIYDHSLFYKLIAGQWREELRAQEKRVDALYREHELYKAQMRVRMHIYNTAREGAMLTATVEAHCHKHLPCKDDPERLCLQDKPFKVIRERRSWSADRAHLLSHLDYLKRCVGAR